MTRSGRVVITGMGAATSLGSTVSSLWQAMLAGRSGIGYIRQFDSSAFPIPIAGEIEIASIRTPGLDEQFPGAGRAARFGCWAADRAWEDAHLAAAGFDTTRAGVSIGASTFPVMEDRLDNIGDLLDGTGWNKGKYLEYCRTRPQLLAQSDAASLSGLLSRRLGVEGPSTTVQAACASATQAIGHAYALIREGRADLMLAGGADSMTSMMCVAGFTLLGSLSRRWSDPTKASRPFDRTRDGFVLAEGAAMLVLESLEPALARGARIHGEIAGYGSSCDAYRFTDIHPEGLGAVLAMKAALRDAEWQPEDVGYINAHGTSTPSNDRIETKAIRKVFGSHADHLAVSSTKSQHGHLLCAAGAIEALLTTLSLKCGTLPGTLNLERPDPECDLDYVPGAPRRADVRFALSNSFGFGGQCGTLALRRWEPQPMHKPKATAPKRAVVATGLGVVSPLGVTTEEHFRRLGAGESGLMPPASNSLAGLPHAQEGLVRNFDRRGQVLHRMLGKLLTASASYAVSAAGQALQAAKVREDRDLLARCGLWVGSLGLDQDLEVFCDGLRASLNANREFEARLFVQNGMSLIDPLFLVKSLPNSGLCGISIQFEMNGPNLNIMNGPASGLQAVVEAAAAIETGRMDCALAGGYDSLLQLEVAVGHCIEGVCSNARTEAGRALGEGAAFVFLESEEHARGRGAPVLAEIAASGQTYSAGSGAEGLARAAALALARAGTEASAVDAVFGDGLTPPSSDYTESGALARLFPGQTPPLRSSIPALGFCGVATGVFSMAHAVQALQARAVQRALVWNSDRERHHVALLAKRSPDTP